MTGFFLPIAIGAAALMFWNPAEPQIHARDLFQYGLSRRGLQLLAVLAGAFGMVVLGWWDDKHELKPLTKFTGQVLIALLVAPYMPETAGKIMETLGSDPEDLSLEGKDDWGGLQSGAKVAKAEPLFPRIEAE